MAPRGHSSRGRGKKRKSAPRSALKKPAAKGNPALKKSASSSQPVASPSDQAFSRSSGSFIFLSDSDCDEHPRTFLPRNIDNSKKDSDPDSVQLISSPILIGTTATSSSAKRMGNRRGRGRGRRGGGVNASYVLQSSASANLQQVIGALSSQISNFTSTLVNSQQSSSTAAGSSRASSRKTRRVQKKKLPIPTQAESDDPSSSDSNCFLGLSPRKKQQKSHEGANKGKKLANKGKKVAKNVKKKCNSDNKPNTTINCGSDSWSCSSSDEQEKSKTSNPTVKQNAMTVVGDNIMTKPKIATNWSDNEDLECIEVLPEAAIFTNRIESYKERMKELRNKEWLAKESLVKELTGNKNGSTAPSKRRRKKKVTDAKESILKSSDDSETEIISKIPVVALQNASSSDDDECNIKLDETITEEHISKTVRNRIERKIRKMQAEQKEMLAIPTSYACSSDDEDLQCLSDSEVDPEIVVKVRWQHKLLKIPMRVSETFAKVFNEIAKKNDLEVSSIMLLLRDKIIALDDTPKLLNVTTGDIFDSCIWNAREEASDTTIKTNYVQIKIQSNDSKVKVPFNIHKLQPMSIVMKDYSQKRNISLEKMIFKFDGEKIDPNSTPFDLDMEDESCIDVKIS